MISVPTNHVRSSELLAAQSYTEHFEGGSVNHFDSSFGNGCKHEFPTWYLGSDNSKAAKPKFKACGPAVWTERFSWAVWNSSCPRWTVSGKFRHLRKRVTHAVVQRVKTELDRTLCLNKGWSPREPKPFAFSSMEVCR